LLNTKLLISRLRGSF